MGTAHSQEKAQAQKIPEKTKSFHIRLIPSTETPYNNPNKKEDKQTKPHKIQKNFSKTNIPKEAHQADSPDKDLKTPTLRMFKDLRETKDERVVPDENSLK